MSPRTIPSTEGQSLLSLVIGLCNENKEHKDECESLLLAYLQMDPEKANYIVTGLPGEQPLAFVIAKAAIGRQILFSVCGKFIDAKTLNYTHEGKSLLSYLSRDKSWRNVIFTESNSELVDRQVFNLVSLPNMPAAIILLRHQASILLNDHMTKLFMPQQLRPYFDFEMMDILLSSNTGITVLLKYSELRKGLNSLLQQRNEDASSLSELLDTVECTVLKRVLANEAKDLKEAGYDSNSNLFQPGSQAPGYVSYQNTNLITHKK